MSGEEKNDLAAQLVLVQKVVDGVGVVTLNRSERRNALSSALITQLLRSLHELDHNTSVRVIILTTAEGQPFSGVCA